MLLSAPYYNAFDNDLTSRAKAKVVEVHLPLPAEGEESSASLDASSFAAETVAAYEEAYQRATKDGVPVKSVDPVQPAQPHRTRLPSLDRGGNWPMFAGKHKLHFVSDEIYARSASAPGRANPRSSTASSRSTLLLSAG